LKVLFIGPTYIGDAAIATGLIDHLLRQHPDARLTIACGSAAAPLFRAAPNLDRIVPVVKRGEVGHWFDLWRQFVGTHWDIVIDLRGSGLAWFLRARKRHVFRVRGDVAHRTQALAATLDLRDLPPPVMWTTAEEDAEARRLLPPGGPVIALGPTGNWPPKLWPAERFVELVRRLTAPDAPLPDARIAVLAAEHERPIVAPLLAGLPPERTIDLVGRLKLTGVCAALKRATLFIGNDSGPLYLAVACGIPAVGLFGPTPGLFGPPVGAIPAPWAPKAAAIRTQESAATVGDTPIDGPLGWQLMDGLTVDIAERGTRQLLARLKEAGDGAHRAGGQGHRL
jgi:ADP-heptose:LPS heptosyltransferase